MTRQSRHDDVWMRRQRAVARRNQRLVVGGAIVAILGILVLAAGVAWPRALPGWPAADSTVPTVPDSSTPAGSPAPSFIVSDPPSTDPSPSTTPTTVPSASAPSPSPFPAPSPPPIPGWTLVANDEFTGTTLDRSKWAPYDSTSTNGVSRWSPSMLTVAGGELRISGQGRDPEGKGNVSGGLCWCRLGQTYGMWQVRARFDAGLGYGQALILWPNSDRWPEDGELDFAETPYPTKQTVAFTVHWGTDNRIDYSRANGDFTQWHTYTVIWKSDSVKMLIDDRTYYDSTASGKNPQIPHTPMHLAMQQEPGPLSPNDWVPSPGAATPDQVIMHIDWVRVYR